MLSRSELNSNLCLDNFMQGSCMTEKTQGKCMILYTLTTQHRNWFLERENWESYRLEITRHQPCRQCGGLYLSWGVRGQIDDRSAHSFSCEIEGCQETTIHDMKRKLMLFFPLPDRILYHCCLFF